MRFLTGLSKLFIVDVLHEQPSFLFGYDSSEFRNLCALLLVCQLPQLYAFPQLMRYVSSLLDFLNVAKGCHSNSIGFEHRHAVDSGKEPSLQIAIHSRIATQMQWNQASGPSESRSKLFQHVLCETCVTQIQVNKFMIVFHELDKILYQVLVGFTHHFFVIHFLWGICVSYVVPWDIQILKLSVLDQSRWQFQYRFWTQEVPRNIEVSEVTVFHDMA